MATCAGCGRKRGFFAVLETGSEGLVMPYAAGDRVIATLLWMRDADWRDFDVVRAPGAVLDVDPTSEAPSWRYCVLLDERLDFRQGQVILTLGEHQLRPEPTPKDERL